MKINTNSMVSITEANQNFSKVARLVDEKGIAVILKKNMPKYVITNFENYQAEEIASDEEVKAVAVRLVNKHLAAFKELADQ